MKPEHKENNNTEEKKIKNSNFIDAWKNAINGIIYATTTQGNIKKQLIIAVAVVITAINAIIVAYFLFFDKISDMGIAFIQNVANSPIHLAFATIVITMIATLAIIAYSKTNKHKVFNEKFVPSGHATIAFAANTIIWITTQNPVILILSLVMAILIAESRIQAKEHKLSEVIFSACMGILIVLIIYSISINLLKF